MFWTLIVLLACDATFSTGNLPPTPLGHLTPPKQPLLQGGKGNTVQKLQTNKEAKQSNLPKESFADSFAKWFLQSSDVAPKPQQPQNTVKKRQEKQIASASNVNTVFLTPGYSILSQAKDCNPCDRVPWVPMARALSGRSYPKIPQYTLSVPTIQVAFPIKEIHYSVPVQQNPTQQFQDQGHGLDDVSIDADSQDEYAPQADYGPPPPEYGPPPVRPPGPQSPPPTYGPPTFPQQLPLTNYGPPFNTGQPSNQYRQPHVRPSLSYLPVAGAFGAHNAHAPSAHSQQQSSSVKVPVLVQNPLPFPLLSTNLMPPMYPYQQFSDGKPIPAESTQSPKKSPPNVVTTPEPNDACKKCKEQNKLKDSEPASAQHAVTEQTGSQLSGNQYGKGTQFEIMKSIPLAEFLASVEYPMQIIQAPILDIPNLPKYFNLGFQNYPHLQDKFNRYQSHNHKTQSFSEQNIGHALFVNNGLQENDNIKSSSIQSTVAASVNPSPTTESGISLPTNHKHTEVYSSSTNQLFHDTTGKPSQEFNINGKGSTLYSSTVVDVTPSLQTHATGSTLPPTPHVSVANSLQLPSENKPLPFLESYNTSSLDQQSNTFINGDKLSELRYLSPPPLPPASVWLSNSPPLPTLSPWGGTPPRPFNIETTHKPRFVVRPSPAPLKKPKLIHQIIVPYTTNKQTQHEFNLNNQGWTPLPPSNQGRKVPPHYTFGERLPDTGSTAPSTGQSTLQYPTGNDFKNTDSQLSKVPLSATGSDNLEDVRFPNGHSPLNLSPELMNQILKQWPALGNTDSGDIQHIITENLQALLNGQQDAVDFERLQKNIDNWTAEGFKQNSPSVNFSPITTLTHLAPSKKIPEEYLTTESTFYNSTEPEEEFFKRSTASPFDYEVSASQNSVVKTASEPHVKFIYNAKDNDSDVSLIHEINGWSLLETKMKTEAPETVTSKPPPLETTEGETKEKLWDKIPVSISPLTNEKVYVVTPLTQTERTTDAPALVQNSSSVSSSRVERSYSVLRSGVLEKVAHLPKSNSIKEDPKENKSTTEDESQIEGKVNTKYNTKSSEVEEQPTIKGLREGSKETSTSDSRLEDEEVQYIHNFPDLFQLLETQEDVDSLRSAAVELKKEKNET